MYVHLRTFWKPTLSCLSFFLLHISQNIFQHWALSYGWYILHIRHTFEVLWTRFKRTLVRNKYNAFRKWMKEGDVMVRNYSANWLSAFNTEFHLSNAKTAFIVIACWQHSRIQRSKRLDIRRRRGAAEFRIQSSSSRLASGPVSPPAIFKINDSYILDVIPDGGETRRDSFGGKTWHVQGRMFVPRDN